MQKNSLFLSTALNESSYPKDRHELIRKLIVNEYTDNKDIKIYFSKEKLFIIEYTLMVYFNGNGFPIYIIVHIPKTFPEVQPIFYIKKYPKTGVNSKYIINNIINERTFQINCESFYNQKKYDIGNIISILNDKFNNDFPIYREENINHGDVIPGKNNLDKIDLKEVKINNEYLNELIKYYKNKIILQKNNNIELNIRINQLNNQLIEEKKKNKRLIEENYLLNCIIENYEKELKEIKAKKEYGTEIILKNDNNSMIKLVEYMKKLEEKEKEIKNLKSKIPFELNESEILMTVIFYSTDQKIHYSMLCKNTDLFSRLESVLYKVEEYKEYKQKENYFIANAKSIDRFETLEKNGIKNGNVIIIINKD